MKEYIRELNDKYLFEEERPKRGWVAVSQSPQGVFYISSEGPYEITSDIDKAEIFANYENALACLEQFQDYVFVDNDRDSDIVHFFKVDKFERP